jgi:hypothetical protein
MWVSRFRSLLRGVGVLVMPIAGLDATRRVESVCAVPPGAGGLRLPAPCLEVGVLI